MDSKAGAVAVCVERDLDDDDLDTHPTRPMNAKGDNNIPMGAIQVKSDIEWSSAEKR